MATPDYTPEDKRRTQESVVASVLMSHCGDGLTPEVIKRIIQDIVGEMRAGACSWAFK